MKFFIFLLCFSLFFELKAQDTLYIKGDNPITAKVMEVSDRGFVIIQKYSNNKVVTEKMNVDKIKSIRYKNGYEDTFKIDKTFYNDTIQLINYKKIICVVKEHNDDINVIVDTYDSRGLISISFDTISSIFYHTGKFELVHELLDLDNNTTNAANRGLIDTAEALNFVNKLNLDDSTLLAGKNDIETIKALFDKYVKSEEYKKDERFMGEKTDSLITELIFEYCRQFNEDYFTGKKAENLPIGEGKLYRVHNQGQVREIQIGEFLEGALTGAGKIIKNSIIEKEGTFRNGELNGKGTIINLEGRRKITGTFVDNLLTGYGETHFSNGAYEKGQYFKSHLTGDGERYLQNGNFYKGSFKDGKYSGLGKYHWAEQNIDFDGEFDNGKRNGLGILTLPNGIRISGLWIDDCPEGKIDIQIQTENAGEMKNSGYWIIKNCTADYKKNKGKIILEENFLSLKTLSFF